MFIKISTLKIDQSNFTPLRRGRRRGSPPALS